MLCIYVRWYTSIEHPVSMFYNANTEHSLTLLAEVRVPSSVSNCLCKGPPYSHTDTFPSESHILWVTRREGETIRQNELSNWLLVWSWPWPASSFPLKKGILSILQQRLHGGHPSPQADGVANPNCQQPTCSWSHLSESRKGAVYQCTQNRFFETGSIQNNSPKNQLMHDWFTKRIKCTISQVIVLRDILPEYILWIWIHSSFTYVQ